MYWKIDNILGGHAEGRVDGSTIRTERQTPNHRVTGVSYFFPQQTYMYVWHLHGRPPSQKLASDYDETTSVL